jgi:hypothetical protein
MEAVFKLPAEPTDAGRGSASDSTISWDWWYARIAKVSERRLLKAVAKRGNPLGSNTISITVWPNHRIAVSLVQGDDPDFDAATLEAYTSLDGNPTLEYPAGSQRKEVNFFIDNKHNTPGAISGVHSQTWVGDQEVQSAPHLFARKPTHQPHEPD